MLSKIFARRSPVVSASELSKILGSSPSNLKVLDCSTDQASQPGDCPRLNYHRCHIPGALFLDLDTLKEQRTNYMMMLPSQQHFSNVMRKNNIRLSDHLVCYDTSPANTFGFRVAWMFKAMGHPNVKVLDGGLAAWANGDHEVSRAEVNESEFNYTI